MRGDPVRRLIRMSTDLVLPVRCLGCNQRAEAWCAECREAALQLHVREHPGGLRTVAASTYDGDVRDAILGYKERARRDLAAPLAWLLDGAIAASTAEGTTALLVPMPSTPAATRRRGGDHLVRLIRALRADHQVAIALGTRRSADATELSASGRHVARDNTMYLRSGADRLLAGRDVVLVDDIVTTGATLERAAELIRAAGAATVTGAVVAQTPKQVSSR